MDQCQTKTFSRPSATGSSEALFKNELRLTKRSNGKRLRPGADKGITASCKAGLPPHRVQTNRGFSGLYRGQQPRRTTGLCGDHEKGSSLRRGTLAASSEAAGLGGSARIFLA